MMLGRMRSTLAQAVQYEAHGDPLQVLKLKELPLESTLGPSQVSFRMLASPINPADINQIQGVYALVPPLPAIAGNEGVAEITHVGSGVTAVRAGDWVIPSQAGYGTWRTEGVWEEAMVQRIPKDVPLEFAATLSVNPCTAYRMLQDFATLREGDLVIQNGANGGVGQAVIQLAARRGIRTINVVRKREALREMERALLDLGGTVVVTDEDLANVTVMQERLAGVLGTRGNVEEGQLPALALNCVGGDNATNMMRYMRPGGTMVTYGGMSKRPLVVPTGSLIFKDLVFRGFWMTRWTQENSSEKREEMLVDLCNLAKAGLFRVEVEKVPLRDFATAMAESLKPFKSGKQLLVM